MSEAHARPMVSVVVPTLNRQKNLKRAILSFLNQDYGNYEIVIVDQSTSELSSDLRAIIERDKKIRYFHIDRAGSPIARNLGVKQSKGEIIISCDDDIVAPLSWITAHANNYHEPVVGAVAGRVLSENERGTDKIREVGKINWLTGNLTNNFNASFRTGVDHAYGCNMSFRKGVFAKTRGFDAVFIALGHFEETDLSLRIRRLGYKIIFDPQAVVRHLQPNSGGNRVQSIDELIFWKFHNYVLLFWKNLDRRYLVIFLVYRFLDIFRWARFYNQTILVFVGLKGILSGFISLIRMSMEGKRW